MQGGERGAKVPRPVSRGDEIGFEPQNQEGNMEADDSRVGLIDRTGKGRSVSSESDSLWTDPLISYSHERRQGP